MSIRVLTLCPEDDCRLLADHKGKHDAYPASAWAFMEGKDRNKLNKAGFATPRGGRKGAYQNHVTRSSQVIIPYEKLAVVPIERYVSGYVIRLYPEQYFEAAGVPQPEFQGEESRIVIGENAYILYRTHESLRRFPPLESWELRTLIKDGAPTNKRGQGVSDAGHYVLRIPPLGPDPERIEGPPQGIFAPEYADPETNYLCKCVLAWLIVQTMGSPYATTRAGHLQAILREEGLLDAAHYEYKGVIRHGRTSCPLCLRFIRYNELHEMVTFEELLGTENAAGQVEGATRSTMVNLFHLHPLRYDEIAHLPSNMAWGHAVCNTRLGQRPCLSLTELMEMDLKVGIIRPEGIETFGWISDDHQMIRSPDGAVWIQLNGDLAEDAPDVIAGEPPDSPNTDFPGTPV